MDLSARISDSITYAKEALIGKWTRWVIFIILALPYSLIRFVIDPKTIMTATGDINWGAIPWSQIALLAAIGFILELFIMGYIVRIYRGVKPAPDFTGWKDLFVDGIKLFIVEFLWFLPAFIVFGAAFAVMFGSMFNPAAMPEQFVFLLTLPLSIIAFILVIIALLFGLIGTIRFAREGSIREGIRYSQVLARIRSIGWVSYIVSLIVFLVTCIVFWIISLVLSLIPYIGWVLVLIISPLFVIFTARYFTLIYEQGEPQPVPPAPVV